MALLPAGDKGYTMETRDVLPAHFLIKIGCFSLLLNHEIQKYESREFVAGGDYKWRLTIYPDGHESGDKVEHISLYLSIAETSSLPVDWEINAVFSIFLYNQILDNYLCFRGKVRRFHAMKTKWGFSKLISTKMLTDPSNGYLVDDNCVFGAEVFVIKSQRVIEFVSLQKVANTHKHAWTISHFSKLKDVWTSEEFTVGDYRWKMKLYPNGKYGGEGQSVSIYLECVDSKSFASHQQVKADFCIRIKNQLHDSRHKSKAVSHCFTSPEGDWGWTYFIPIADMRDPSKGFAVDDCCVLETEITVQVDDASNSSK